MTRHVILPPTLAQVSPPTNGVLARLSGETMGTNWSLHMVSPPGPSDDQCRAIVLGAFDHIIATMSGWEPTSELCLFNAAEAGTQCRLSDDFSTVLTRALELAEDTNGAFSPTLGAVIDDLGFGPSAHASPDGRRNTTVERNAWRRLMLGPGSRAIVQPGGVTLDLSAIAKGYAVDLAATRLLETGTQHFLIEIGGEFRGEGVKPDGQPWWVALERPPKDTANTSYNGYVAALCGYSVATSGDYHRCRTVDGQLLSHIVSETETSMLASVSVFHRSCMEADAAATAIIAMGAECGLAFAEAHALPALLVRRTEAGLSEVRSPALEELLSDAEG